MTDIRKAIRQARLRYALIGTFIGILFCLPALLNPTHEFWKNLCALLPSLALSPTLRVWIILSYYPRHTTSKKVAYDALCTLIPFEISHTVCSLLFVEGTEFSRCLLLLALSVFLAVFAAFVHHWHKEIELSYLRANLGLGFLCSIAFAEALHMAFFKFGFIGAFTLQIARYLVPTTRLFFCLYVFIDLKRRLGLHRANVSRVLLVAGLVFSPFLFWLSVLGN